MNLIHLHKTMDNIGPDFDFEEFSIRQEVDNDKLYEFQPYDTVKTDYAADYTSYNTPYNTPKFNAPKYTPNYNNDYSYNDFYSGVKTSDSADSDIPVINNYPSYDEFSDFNQPFDDDNISDIKFDIDTIKADIESMKDDISELKDTVDKIYQNVADIKKLLFRTAQSSVRDPRPR